MSDKKHVLVKTMNGDNVIGIENKEGNEGQSSLFVE